MFFLSSHSHFCIQASHPSASWRCTQEGVRNTTDPRVCSVTMMCPCPSPCSNAKGGSMWCQDVYLHPCARLHAPVSTHASTYAPMPHTHAHALIHAPRPMQRDGTTTHPHAPIHVPTLCPHSCA